MKKPIMTLSEVVEDLRGLGMKISTNSLSDGIASGLYPFGKIASTGDTGRRNIRIFRTDYEQWKRDFLLGQGSVVEIIRPPIPPLDWELISTNTFTQENKDIMWEVIIRSWAKRGGDSTSG